MVPTSDSSNDLVGILCPYEGLWVLVGFLDESVYGGLEVDDRVEDAALEAPFGQLGKIAFDGIEPGTRCRGEMERPSGMALEPLLDLGVLVGGVVVEDHVDALAGGNVALDDIEKADERLMAVALHVAADDSAVEHVQGGKERGGCAFR